MAKKIQPKIVLTEEIDGVFYGMSWKDFLFIGVCLFGIPLLSWLIKIF